MNLSLYKNEKKIQIKLSNLKYKWHLKYGLIALFFFLMMINCTAESYTKEESTPTSMLEIYFDKFFHGMVTDTNFSSDVSAISLFVASQYPEWVELKTLVIADDVKGIKSQSVVLEDGLFIAPEERKKIQLKAPPKGFLPGHYHVEVNVDGKLEQTLSLEIVPAIKVKAPIKSADSDTNQYTSSQKQEPALGFNLALKTLGGKLEHCSSQQNNGDFAAANLIDGRRYQTIGGDPMFCKPCGWRAGSDEFPQEMVFSFYENREALINVVVIDTYSLSSLEFGKPVVGRFPKEVEVWVSTTNQPESFVLVAAKTLDTKVGEHMIRFNPVKARYVKLKILSSQGGKAVQLAEVKVLEAGNTDSTILKDFPRDIASTALGGSVVWHTSGYYSWEAGRLIMSRDSDSGQQGWQNSRNEEFPQSFVFAFNESRTAFIDRMVIDPRSGLKPESQAKIVVLSLSNGSALKGFQEVGRIEFALEDGAKTYSINQYGRFLKLDILENHGANFASLGHVQIFEGDLSTGTSVLSVIPPSMQTPKSSKKETAAKQDSSSLQENEPNDTPDKANELKVGSTVSGNTLPQGDVDYFRIPIPEGKEQNLNISLSGWPVVNFLDSSGNVLDKATRSSEFSWRPRAGDNLLKVVDPPASVLLMLDESDSMTSAADEVKQAVRKYIEVMPPGVRVNIIRFAGKPCVVLPDFSSDKAELVNAIDRPMTYEDIKMGTSLYRALIKGLHLLGMEGGKTALVVLTDGYSPTIGNYQQKLWSLLPQYNTRIYSVGLGAALEDISPLIGSSSERGLKELSRATGGRYLRAESEEMLVGLFHEIADYIHSDPNYSISVHPSMGEGHLSVIPIEENIVAEMTPTFELILDASGSMNQRMKGSGNPRKIDLAKDVLSEIIKSLPDSSIVALRIFGHRIKEGEQGDCYDTELLIPFEKIDKAKLLKAVKGINALGTTLIAHSLKEAGNDLPVDAIDRRIVLITDGKEECGSDPTETVIELQKEGIDIQIDVVGFALEDDESKKAIKQIADLSKGDFFDVQDRQGLLKSVRKTLTPSYDVLDVKGERVAQGKIGSGTLELPEGTYQITVPLTNGVLKISDVHIEQNYTTKVRLSREDEKIVGSIYTPMK